MRSSFFALLRIGPLFSLKDFREGIMSKNVTMRDIAEKLGISVVAVSKGLSGKSGVSAELRSKIRRTAEEMGYQAGSGASKKDAFSGNIGIIVAERYISDNSFYFKFIHIISKVLQQHNNYAVFHTLTAKNEENVILPDLFFHRRVDGIIILGQVSDEYTSAVIDAKIPVVFLDFYNEFTADCCVISDSFYGTYEMTNYLIRNGHKNIAFVGNIYTTSSIQDRYLGYAKSLIEHKMPLKDYYIISDRDTDTGRFIPLELPIIMPTAFVCNCDETACKLISVLKESGYKVPEDISVTGFDNSVYSSISVPEITTIEVNTAQMASVAVESLLTKIRTPSAHIGMVQVKGRILFKESVKSLNYQ